MRLRILSATTAHRRTLERVAFGLLGVSAVLIGVGLYGQRGIRAAAPKPSAPVVSPAPVAAKAAPVPPPVPAVKSEPAPEPKPSPAPPETRLPPAPKPHAAVVEKVRPAPEEPKRHGFELRGTGSMIVLAMDDSGVLEMRRTPGRMKDLVVEGRAFSAPNHTAVFIEEVRGGLMRVRILRDSLKGRVGWVPSDMVGRW